MGSFSGSSATLYGTRLSIWAVSVAAVRHCTAHDCPYGQFQWQQCGTVRHTTVHMGSFSGSSATLYGTRLSIWAVSVAAVRHCTAHDCPYGQFQWQQCDTVRHTTVHMGSFSGSSATLYGTRLSIWAVSVAAVRHCTAHDCPYGQFPWQQCDTVRHTTVHMGSFRGSSLRAQHFKLHNF